VHKPWEENFCRLKNFKESNGTCCVPASRDKQLARWIAKQRENYKNDLIPSERIQQLEEIGFNWKPRATISWEENWNKLKEFKELNGHCNVPAKVDKRLNTWVHNQRQAQKEGKLSQERVYKLEELGLQLKCSTASKPLPWNEQFNSLKRFNRVNQHCNVTRGMDKKLHRWVTKQRENFKQGTLSQEKRMKLEELGFKWTLQGSAQFKK